MQDLIGAKGLQGPAFEQIRHYSASDIAVSLRLLRALDDIASTCTELRTIESLAMRGQRIVAGCAERLSAEQTEKLRSRLHALEARLQPFVAAGASQALPQS